MLTPDNISELAVKALEDKKAVDITVLRTTKVTVLADYFVICTANSTTHMKTLSDEVEKVLKESGEAPLHREGRRVGGWLLVDFGCVVVHIFLKETREFYTLERLWADAEKIMGGEDEQ
ncbi:MAG: ribosome silencing factor [Oscillospiraceae bacterium]|jgi:ribosome-associated protein|nr:ribosome silencing factor [Oscillospiraceae bacterium]